MQQELKKQVSAFSSSHCCGYFNMKGDGAMLAYTKIWMKGVVGCQLTKLYKRLLE